jgi:hypothetical protein
MLIATHTARREWEEARAAFTRALAHGGPDPLFFRILLAEWQEQMDREGQHPLFAELCREWQALAVSAGIRTLPMQWFLEPAEPQSGFGQPLLDVCFAEGKADSSVDALAGTVTRPGPGQRSSKGRPLPGLPAELTWVDPMNLGAPEWRPGRPFTLAPPPGPDLWPPNNMNAPRLMLSVEGDFIAETFLIIGERGALLAGLLLWSSERDYIRLERVRAPSFGDGIHLEACAGGHYCFPGHGRFPAPGVWLRLERIGKNVRGLCSEDRRQWWTSGAVTFPEGGPVHVGLTCIAHAIGATASFERFVVWKRAGEEAAGA